MRLDIFTIPAFGGEDEIEAVNQLLSTARVLKVDRHLISDGPDSYWSICVSGPWRHG